tara:strand:- start:108 stop:713 length:606 start_codon:yes stop_codon:yes gene_type:complete
LDELKKSVIWVRRARCAGSSIKKILQEKNILQMWSPNLDSIDDSKILLVPGRNFDLFKKDNIDHFNKSFKFSTIRNPWDRFISGWKHCLKKDNFLENKSIKDILLNLPTIEEHPYDYWHLTKTLSDTFIVNDKNIMDFIIKFENLQNDFDLLCGKIGIERMILPHENKSIHNHYSDYFDKETKDIFFTKYKKDIEYFDYKY